VDADQDGYTTCDGDCDDANELVNPGAYDFPNSLDDDCDGTVDNPFTDCASTAMYTSQSADDYAHALDICQSTTMNATGVNKKWGLITAQFTLSDGTGTPAPHSHAIMGTFGSMYTHKKGGSMVLFSTGEAADSTQSYWTADTPQPGTNLLNAAGTALPNGFPTTKQGCPTPGNLGFDSVALKLVIRVPSNAAGIAFDHAFFTSEYPEKACTVYNDQFIALLTSGAPGTPSDHNVLTDPNGVPESVNMDYLDRCVASDTGCDGTAQSHNYCGGGVAELAGTGFETQVTGCTTMASVGAGTGWLTTDTPVVPGEIMELTFMLWDATDALLDSSVLVDNFRFQRAARNLPLTHR